MKSVFVLIAVVATVSFASAVRVAGIEGICRLAPDPARDSRLPIADCRLGDREWEDTVVIAYDDGTHRTWWCSDRDSFGAAVRFTPTEYPCQVVGARAEVGYDDGQQVYLRVFDDNGTGGLPGTVLYEQQRLDIPHGQNPGFKDYDLTAPVTIDSGDFYICFWQKHYFHLLFGTDTHFDSMPREWWFFPDLKWVTPMGMDAADMLIRARVLYGTGVEEELTPHLMPRLTVSPNPLAAGFVHLAVGGTSLSRPALVRLYDAAGRCVGVWKPLLRNGAADLDVRRLAAGVYLVRVEADGFTATEKLVVQR